ncbi:hypothetical protein MASR1M12_01250 [Erysipelotrichia bacterium]
MNAKTKEILTLLNGMSFAEARNIFGEALAVLDYAATVNFVSEGESRKSYNTVNKSVKSRISNCRITHPLDGNDAESTSA